MTEFSELGLSPETLQAVADSGYTTATPIQAEAIPIALAGSDIQTNPPATNEAVSQSDLTFTRRIDKLPPEDVVGEIDRLVDMERLETVLMAEGVSKFANPQKALLARIAEKRATVATR